jgi:hypothetical protein
VGGVVRRTLLADEEAPNLQTVWLIAPASVRGRTTLGISTTAGMTKTPTMNNARLAATPSGGALRKTTPTIMIQAGTSRLRVGLTKHERLYRSATTLSPSRAPRCADVLGLWMTTGLAIAASIAGGLVSRLLDRPRDHAVFHQASFFVSLDGTIRLLVIWKLAPSASRWTTRLAG